MPKFSDTSNRRLGECHIKLQILFNAVIQKYDCSILCGHRTKEEQDLAFAGDKSKLQFPQSKHNSLPSMAVDVAPYPIDWNDEGRFIRFAGRVEAIASMLGIKVRWGGDWDQDGQLSDNKFNDLVHFELTA